MAELTSLAEKILIFLAPKYPSHEKFSKRVLFQANPASTPLSDSLSDTEAA
jgi:hypothetical protein